LRVFEAIQIGRDELDVRRALIGCPPQQLAIGRRSDAGDELRAIKRYLATRTDNLPWLSYQSAIRR
jgi:hypothetical protein